MQMGNLPSPSVFARLRAILDSELHDARLRQLMRAFPCRLQKFKPRNDRSSDRDSVYSRHSSRPVFYVRYFISRRFLSINRLLLCSMPCTASDCANSSVKRMPCCHPDVDTAPDLAYTGAAIDAAPASIRANYILPVRSPERLMAWLPLVAASACSSSGNAGTQTPGTPPCHGIRRIFARAK